MTRYLNEENVCGGCFNDVGLKDFILNHATSEECSFCGAQAKTAIRQRDELPHILLTIPNIGLDFARNGSIGTDRVLMF